MEIRFLSEIVDSNTIICLTKTWLDETCDHKIYSFCKTTHEIFRCDRNKKCTGQHAGGGTLLLIPKKFNPKIREDLNYLRPSHFEGLWVEYSPIISKKSKRQIIAFAYNPHKQFNEIFIEDTLKGIDYAASEARDVTILGDFNINYLNKHEAKFLSDSIKPYNLSITNKSIPTYNSKNSQSILDNIIATKSFCK